MNAIANAPATNEIPPETMERIIRVGKSQSGEIVTMGTCKPLNQILPCEVQRLLAGPTFERFLYGRQLFCKIQQISEKTADSPLVVTGIVIPRDNAGRSDIGRCFRFRLEHGKTDTLTFE